VFAIQRFANDYRGEPLVGVLPGVAAEEIWQIVGVAERAMLAISSMVFIVGLAGLVAVVLAGLGERRRELAILRSVGARPRDVFVLLSLEAVLIALLAIVFAVLLLYALSSALAPIVQAHFGIALDVRPLSQSEWALLAAVVAVAGIASIIPGCYAYRLSLADGLSPRI
jgi:putative ABC transport system permease protein